MTAPELSVASRRYLDRRSPEERRALGQHLTPRSLREPLLDRIPIAAGASVLDPGVGTGEFLLSVRERRPDARLVGWDVDAAALEVARGLVPDAELVRRSALDPLPDARFDVVVGNPPYFQLKLSDDERRRFAPVISGRANIFALFLQVGLELLRPSGWLGFVVPPSMNNGAYFQALRDHIATRSTIEHLEVRPEQGHFAGARTAVQLLVLRKGEDGRASTSDRHLLDLREVTGGALERTVLCEDPDDLRAAFAGRATLWQLGYRAVTGSIVWNQERDRLRPSPGPGTVPLIWAHNIADGRLDLAAAHRGDRPQHIAADAPLHGPAIVVNRVVGAVGAGRLRCARIDGGTAFLAENHVNVVVRRDHGEPEVGWSDLHERLRGPHVGEHLVRLTGNTQLSATELTHLVPV